MNFQVRVGATLVATALAGCSSGRCGLLVFKGFEQLSDAGAVVFGTTAVGEVAAAAVPVRDSVDVEETITGATLEGSGAAEFHVTSTFPVTVPAGSQVSLGIAFAPTAPGLASATLVLETAAMGPSPIALQGLGQ